jgi:hypothetical protein
MKLQLKNKCQTVDLFQDKTNSKFQDFRVSRFQNPISKTQTILDLKFGIVWNLVLGISTLRPLL